MALAFLVTWGSGEREALRDLEDWLDTSRTGCMVGEASHAVLESGERLLCKSGFNGDGLL